MDTPMESSPYRRLMVMASLSVVSMYLLMYAMVNSVANALANLNQLYMAILMAAPMVLIELVLMGAMYRNKKLTIMVAAASVVALAAFFIGIRRQTAIGDRQFLRSMIPHHAAAILMCEEASLQGAAIKTLCAGIISRQEAEIEEMKVLLGR